ncbi:MAG: pantoate--beta-alanine ligase [Solirubrobacterales bacterium]
MRVERTRSGVRRALVELGAAKRTVGLVPTMGYLHDGHLSLLEASVARCDLTVMSLFVNPTQFRPGEDLDRYPRDEERDLEVAEAAGVDLVYAPEPGEVYPEGFCTYVSVEGLTDVLCGGPESRGRDHFRGVTTVVCKLLNTVGPDYAFFGRKDAQQAIVISRMVGDLDLPVEIVSLPTIRDPDGLALSSRNAYLDPSERERALAISRALGRIELAAEGGEDLRAALEGAREELAAEQIEPEYLEARDARDLSPIDRFNGQPVLVAVAAPVGETRLIDNVLIPPRPMEG